MPCAHAGVGVGQADGYACQPGCPAHVQAWGGLAACPPSLTLGCPAQARGDSAGHAVLPCPPAKGRAAERLPPAYALAGTLHTAPTFLRAAAGLQAAPPPPAQARKPKGLATVTCPLLSPLYATCKGWTAERLPPAYAMPCLPPANALAGTLHTAPTFLRAAAGLQAAPPPPAQARKPKGLATVTCPLLSPLHATCKGWTAERLPPAYAMPCLPRQTPLLDTAPTFLRAAAGLQAAPSPPAQARKPKGLATVTCPLLSPLYATGG